MPEKAEEQAAELLQMAIDNFKRARSAVEPVTGLPMSEAVVGFSTESILEALGGTLDPLLDAIKNGTIRGVAGPGLLHHSAATPGRMCTPWRWPKS